MSDLKESVHEIHENHETNQFITESGCLINSAHHSGCLALFVSFVYFVDGLYFVSVRDIRLVLRHEVQHAYADGGDEEGDGQSAQPK